MLYDVTNQKEENGIGFGAGSECDGMKSKLVVGKGMLVAVAVLQGGEWVDLGGKGYRYPEGTYDLMADLGTNIRYTPMALPGFKSMRDPEQLQVQDGVAFDQNFFAAEAAAQEPEPEDFAEAFETVDPFEAETRARLTRIEEKVDRLLKARPL